MSGWTCPHGVGEPAQRGDCELCNTEFAARPAPADMTGTERAAEVTALLHEPSSYRVGDIHGRIEGLVGRPVWTHEFVTDLALAAEAESWSHPADLNAHAIRTLEAVADGKPILKVTR